MKNFVDKVVVVTGAGSGMGRAYAQAFGQLGAKLALNDFDATSLAETKALLEKSGVKEIFCQDFDVSNKTAMYAFAKSTQSVLGNAHVVINNAGIEGANQPVFNVDEDWYDKVLGVNFYGVLYGTKAFLPQLAENNEGAIVNVSSVFGLIGTPNSGEYCASKFAVRGFTEALMVEFSQSPISIHCLYPGGVATNIVRSDNEEFGDKFLITPPEDVAQYVIACIKKGKEKIVYGHSARKIWLASNWVPQSVLNKILWKQFRSIIDLEHYPKFITSFKKK